MHLLVLVLSFFSLFFKALCVRNTPVRLHFIAWMVLCTSIAAWIVEVSLITKCMDGLQLCPQSTDA